MSLRSPCDGLSAVRSSFGQGSGRRSAGTFGCSSTARATAKRACSNGGTTRRRSTWPTSLRARNRSGGAADEARVVLAVRVLYSPVRTKKSLQTAGVRKVVASRADFEAKDGASGQEK